MWLKVGAGAGDNTIFSRSNETDIDLLVLKYNMDTELLTFNLAGIEVVHSYSLMTTWSHITATYEEFTSVTSSKLRIYTNSDLGIQGWFE